MKSQAVAVDVVDVVLHVAVKAGELVHVPIELRVFDNGSDLQNLVDAVVRSRCFEVKTQISHFRVVLITFGFRLLHGSPASIPRSGWLSK
jgi:hypothetical protein